MQKETVYENGYRLKGIVVYVIQSKREEIDNIMQSFEIPEMKDIKYISFKNTTSDDKVRVLHLNKIYNGKVRFETLCTYLNKTESRRSKVVVNKLWNNSTLSYIKL